MMRPLVALSIFFCAGVAAAEQQPIPFSWLALVLFFLCPPLAVARNRNTPFFLCVFIFTFLLGAAYLQNARIEAPRHLTRMNLDCYDSPCLLKGTIRTHPQEDSCRVRFIFEPCQVQCNGSNRSCCGKVLLVAAPGQGFSYGEELIVKARLRRLSGTYGDYLQRQGVGYVIKTAHASAVFKTGANKSTLFERWAVNFRHQAKCFISGATSPVAGSILNAMILGEKEGVPRMLVGAMTKAGTVHILVVSGFNVGLVIMVMLLSLKALGIPRNLRLLIGLGGACAYCFITGSSSPVMRATAMAVALVIALLFKKEPDIYNCLALAALCIVGQNPHQLFETGFQLSFASVAAIAFVYPRLKAMLGVSGIKMRLFRYITEGVAVSYSAWLGTAAIIAYDFKIISPITVIANILVVPLASCITVTGFIFIGASFIAPALAQSIAYSLELMVFVLIKINTIMVMVPGAYYYLP